MLLRFSPPAMILFPSPTSDLRGRNHPTLLPFHRQLHHFKLSRFIITPRASFPTSDSSSGYRKVPLETGGAYRLIDDETGKSVILWGGLEEGHDLNLPSKEAIFSSSTCSSASAPSSTTSSVGGQRTNGAAAIGRFGKLKAHKVRTLLIRSVKNRESRLLDQDSVGSVRKREHKSLDQENSRNRISKLVHGDTVGSVGNTESKSLYQDSVGNRESKSLDQVSFRNRISRLLDGDTVGSVSNREPKSPDQDSGRKSEPKSLYQESLMNSKSKSLDQGSVRKRESKSLNQESFRNRMSKLLDGDTAENVRNRNSKSLDQESAGKRESKSLYQESFRKRESESLHQENFRNRMSKLLDGDSIRNRNSKSIDQESINKRESKSLYQESFRNRISKLSDGDTVGSIRNWKSKSLDQGRVRKWESKPLYQQSFRNTTSKLSDGDTVGSIRNHESKSLGEESFRKQESKSLHQESIRNRISKLLDGETVGSGNRKSKSLDQESVKNRESESLNQDSFENKEFKSLSQDSVRNRISKLLVRDTVESVGNRESKSLDQESVRNRESKSLNHESSGNRETKLLDQDNVMNAWDKEYKSPDQEIVMNRESKSLNQESVGNRESKLLDQDTGRTVLNRESKSLIRESVGNRESKSLNQENARNKESKSLDQENVGNMESKLLDQDIARNVLNMESKSLDQENVRNRESRFLDEGSAGVSHTVSVESFSDSEFDDVDEDDEEEDLVEPPRVHARVNSGSNFLETLQRGEEVVGEEGMISEDYARVSPSTTSSFSLPSGKGGWGVIGTPHTNRFRQPKKKESKNDDEFFSMRSFKDLGCTDDILEALGKLQFRRPSHIQAMSYAHVIEGKTCIIADQSGSGKTLAYLTPLIQCLRQEEILGTAKSMPKNPRVIVLVPTAELASQVLVNCRSMSKYGVPFRSIVATGGFRQRTQLESLEQELDVLIATPGRFIYLLKEGFLELANLKSVVLDEVDILFNDEEFEVVLENLIRCAPVTTQYLFVTATLPVEIYNKLVEVFPDCEVLMGPGMHRTSSGLEEILIDCSGDGEEKNPDTAFLNKKSALLRIVEESPVNKTIVFCNKIETCRKVENALKRHDRKETQIKVLPFHSALDQKLRLSNLKDFLNSETRDQLFLVCTDRASRGIDFKAVDHAILFDLPRDPSEYVRRVGRIARGAGGMGKAFVFAVGKQVYLAQRIILRNQKGHPLHEVPC